MSTDLLRPSDGSPDDDVIDAAGAQMALYIINNEHFDTTDNMAGFQTGFTRGFIEGAKFMLEFHRIREGKKFLAKMERKLESKAEYDEYEKMRVDMESKRIKAMETGESQVTAVQKVVDMGDPGFYKPTPVKDIAENNDPVTEYEVYWYNREERSRNTKFVDTFTEMLDLANKMDADQDTTGAFVTEIHKSGKRTEMPREQWCFSEMTGKTHRDCLQKDSWFPEVEFDIAKYVESKQFDLDCKALNDLYELWTNKYKFSACGPDVDNIYAKQIIKYGKRAIPFIYRKIVYNPDAVVMLLDKILPGTVTTEGLVSLGEVCKAWTTTLSAMYPLLVDKAGKTVAGVTTSYEGDACSKS